MFDFWFLVFCFIVFTVQFSVLAVFTEAFWLLISAVWLHIIVIGPHPHCHITCHTCTLLIQDVATDGVYLDIFVFSDHATELRVAKAKISELETFCYGQKTEVTFKTKIN